MANQISLSCERRFELAHILMVCSTAYRNLSACELTVDRFVVLVSPEIALSDPFLEILQDQRFQKRLVLVAIDELHIVDQWGTFRKPYSQLAILRDRIDRRVPWFGTSATLDPIMLEQVKKLVGFAPDVKVIRTSMDRPDIRFIIQPMQHAWTSFKDLEFLVENAKEQRTRAVDGGFVDMLANLPADEEKTAGLQDAIRQGKYQDAWLQLQGKDLGSFAREQTIKSNSAQKELAAIPQSFRVDIDTIGRQRCRRIPKTIVYMEHITDIELAAQFLISRIVAMGISMKVASDAIKCYHSELAEDDKRAISTQFARRDCDRLMDCSKYRIILATDAMGMGINNPDIFRVVQYRLPASMCSLMQRAGRAA